MKRLLALWGLLAFCTTSMAQNDDEYEAFKKQATAEFNTYTTNTEREYANYRDKANAEYAAFVEQAWTEMYALAGIKPPAPPKPLRPQHQQESAPDRMPISIPYDSIVPMPMAPVDIEMPQIPYTAASEDEQEEVDFFATKVVVRAVKKMVLIQLTSLAEKEVAKAWRQMSKGNYDGLLGDCLRQHNAMKLCDWAYIQFCGTVAERVFGKKSNEAVLLQAFLLTQSGYRVRMAESEGKLFLLMPFDHTIYNYAYITIDGLKYYVIDGKKSGIYRVCQASFPREYTASISIPRQPQLAMRATPTKTFGGSGRYPTMKVSLGVNKNLMNFYSQYPISDAWSSYSKASLSEATKASLYPALRRSIQGKSKWVATDMLLDFVQHAFGYKTDQEQFGYERPLFGDESFFYPYNDCEDRSILFSILVRELMGLDVVLLHYPGHLATAVNLGASEQGDYVLVDGKRYTVCDPTYIGASVGEAMPDFKNEKVRVIIIGDTERK
ncbi:MAG: hypothetical protein IJ789_00485 [Bacteroidales bacterium]|nr:hypothetical protein [Bacteroidales bacterium]